MKLKYYLRGLGIGILVTAVIMGVTAENRKPSLSDNEIKRRARELGMVEAAGSLADLETEEGQTAKAEPTVAPAVLDAPKDTEEPTETPEPTEKPTAEPEATEKPTETPEPTEKPTEKPTAEPEATEKPTAKPTEAPEATESPTAAPAATEEPAETSEGSSAVMFEVQVKAGDGSYAVCKRLEELGLITSASEYDNYLWSRGYDRKLRTGIHQVPADASKEEIALILTGSR